MQVVTSNPSSAQTSLVNFFDDNTSEQMIEVYHELSREFLGSIPYRETITIEELDELLSEHIAVVHKSLRTVYKELSLGYKANRPLGATRKPELTKIDNKDTLRIGTNDIIFIST